MKRVAVVGVTGAGKTTFARALSQRLGVPHVEMDALHWLPNWTMPAPEEFRERIAAEVSRPAWVIEGNYSKTRDMVWRAADTLIWLDYSLAVIFARLLLRTLRRGARRELLWGTNRERFFSQFFSSKSLFLWALQTHPRYRRDYTRLIASAEYAHLRVVHLHAPAQAEAWLANCLAS